MQHVENQMVIGPYYPDPPRPEPDPDEAYERIRQFEIDEEANARDQQERDR